MSYKGQVLRGEKWNALMTAKQLKEEPEGSSKLADIAVYKEHLKKEAESKKKQEVKPKEKK